MRFAAAHEKKQAQKARHGNKFRHHHKVREPAPGGRDGGGGPSGAPTKPGGRAAGGSVGATPGPKERAYQLKVDAARAVGYRETLLMQLNAVVLHWPRRAAAAAASDMGARAAAEAARLLRNISSELRVAGLRCVEKIVAWVLHESADASEPAPFLWNGKDYLFKMSDDLDFVADTLGPEAWRAASFCRGNPLLLTRDEINGAGHPTKIGRLQAASVVILDVVRRHRLGAAARHRAAKAVAQNRAAERHGHAVDAYSRGSRGSLGDRSRAPTPDAAGERPVPEDAPRAPAAGGGARAVRAAKVAGLPVDFAPDPSPPEPTPVPRAAPPDPRSPRRPAPPASPSPAAPAKAAATPPAANASPRKVEEPAAPDAFSVGDRVEADFEGAGEYYEGAIAGVNADGTYKIAYDDGDEESGVEAARIRGAEKRAAPAIEIAEPSVAEVPETASPAFDGASEPRSPAAFSVSSASPRPRTPAAEPAAAEPEEVEPEADEPEADEPEAVEPESIEPLVAPIVIAPIALHEAEAVEPRSPSPRPEIDDASVSLEEAAVAAAEEPLEESVPGDEVEEPLEEEVLDAEEDEGVAAAPPAFEEEAYEDEDEEYSMEMEEFEASPVKVAPPAAPTTGPAAYVLGGLLAVLESITDLGGPGISSNPSTLLKSNSFSMIIEPLILASRVLDD